MAIAAALSGSSTIMVRKHSSALPTGWLDGGSNRRFHLVVLDTETLERRQMIEVGSDFASMALSRDGTRLFVVDTSAATVKVFDTTTGRVLRSVVVGTSAVFVVPAP